MKILITLLSSLFITSAFAAVNPTGSSTTASEGTLTVQVQVGQLVQITGATDVTIPSWDGSSTTQTQNLCVFSNNTTPAKGYSIAFSDANTDFKLKSSAGDEIAYTLIFNGAEVNTNTTGTSALATQQVGSDRTNCNDAPNGTTNATLAITIPAKTGLHGGTFTDTLSLIVSAPT
jgi:hypothetical protein